MTTHHRQFCWKCYRAKDACLCSEFFSIANPYKIILLSHPKESRRTTSTGRMSHLMLNHSEFWIYDPKTTKMRLSKELSKIDTHTYLLFPGDNAIAVDSDCSSEIFQGRDVHKIQFLVIESTWYQAKKMLAETPLLNIIPKVSFNQKYISKFKFRTQPADHCLSTIESIYYLLKATDKQTGRYEPLVEAFESMVNFQINAQKKFHPNHFRKWEE